MERKTDKIRVGLITVHVGFNFGSILQTIASFEAFRTLGCEVEVINYIPDRVTYKRYWKVAFSSLRNFIRKTLSLPIFIINRHLYTGFLRKYVKLSPPIYTTDDFVEKCPRKDIYVTGSDQVWNSKHNEGIDTRYFFTGIDGECKISYASSIGQSHLSAEEKDVFRQALSGYSGISVREESAKQLLLEIGIPSLQLLDPTFILDRSEWRKYMSDMTIKEPYLLVYAPYNIKDEEAIYTVARKIARYKNLKVITFSWSIVRNPKADKTVCFASPGDFLRLMNDAAVVLTNSFHGTAFSINLNKQFWVFNPSAFSTRIESILKLLHLEDRLLMDGDLGNKQDSVIDFAPVNGILQNERERAYAFLEKCIKKCI